MFNEEQKRRFLENKSFEKNGMSVWFNRVEALELEKNKDFSEFSKEEIMEFLKSTDCSSWKYLKHILYFFRSYANWCLENTELKEHAFGDIAPSELQQFVNEKHVNDSIVTRENILYWIESGAIENPRDQFCILCLFEGIKGNNYQEILNVTREDIFMEDDKYFFRISRDGVGASVVNAHEVSKELYEVAIKAYNKLTYISTSSKKPRQYYLKKSERVFKEFYNTADDIDDDKRGRAIYSSLKRSLTQLYNKNITAVKLKPKDIYFSGIINDILELSIINDMTPHEVLCSEHIKKVEQKFNTTIEPTDYTYRYFDYLA